MSEVHKLVVALDDRTDAQRDGFVAWTHEVARSPSIVRAEIETVEPVAHAAHTTKVARWSAFASLWAAPAVIDTLVGDLPSDTTWFRVRERLAFDRSARPDDARPWAGVKKTTPWAPVAGVDAFTWQARYTNHGEVARAHHATCVRYRQNVVLASSDPEIGAISELWWTNVEDLLERFYASPDAQRLVGVDASGFVDATRAHPVVTIHATLRANPVTTARAFLPDADG